MSEELSQADRASIENIVKRLEAAWNAKDGAAFGAPFASNADFVTIRAEHLRGQSAIAAGHQSIFDTIYAGSDLRCTLESVRLLRPDIALTHVRSELNAPQGPLAGRHVATFSMVLTRNSGGWQIAAFHNTLQPPQGPPR
jgi:uncharacterized protein (TIGR02246 family)